MTFTLSARGYVIGLVPGCCDKPKPMYEVAPPSRPALVRHLRIVCVNCWARLVELSWEDPDFERKPDDAA